MARKPTLPIDQILRVVDRADQRGCRFSFLWWLVALAIAAYLIAGCSVKSGSIEVDEDGDLTGSIELELELEAHQSAAVATAMAEDAACRVAPKEREFWGNPDGSYFPPSAYPLVLAGGKSTESHRWITSLNGQRMIVAPMNSTTEFDWCDVRLSGGRNRKLLWPIRVYGMSGLLQNCTFENVQTEHGFYGEWGPGDFSAINCVFRDTASQGFQARFKETRPQDSPWWNFEATVLFDSCLFARCESVSGTRPAFAFSPKDGGPNRDLIVKNTTFKDIGPFGSIAVEYWRSVSIDSCTFTGAPSNYFTVQAFEHSNGNITLEMAPEAFSFTNNDLGGGEVAVKPALSDIKISGCKNGRIVVLAWTNGAWRPAFTLAAEAGYESVR